MTVGIEMWATLVGRISSRCSGPRSWCSPPSPSSPSSSTASSSSPSSPWIKRLSQEYDCDLRPSEKLHFRNSIEFHKCTFSLTAIWQVDGRQPPKVRNSSSSVRHRNQDAGISAMKRATGNQLNFVSVLFHQPPFCQVDGRHSYSYCIGYWYRYRLSAISISRTTLR